METIQFKGWSLWVDPKATAKDYQSFDGGIADGCLCNDCRNFVAIRDHIFPEEIKMLFTALGIDYTKECENMHYQKLDNELHYYHFWYHFKGKIIHPANEELTVLHSAPNALSIGFGAIQYPTFFKDTEHLLQVEFHAAIPWIIDKALETE